MRYILGLLLLASPAFAGDLATGGAIKAALVGSTLEGSMAASGAFAEYYAPDGTIHAAEYSGLWSVKGDKMCFAYGSEPENCWSMKIDGASVVLIGDAGEEGRGKIKPGNPGGW